MDRNSLIKGYFFSGVHYGDILRALAAHAIIVSNRTLMRILSVHGLYHRQNADLDKVILNPYRAGGYIWMYASGPWARYLQRSA